MLFVVSTGPDWWSEIWADGQIWASHRQSDESPGLPRCQRDPRCNQSKTFTLCIWEPLFPSCSCIFNLILCFQGVGTNEKCLIEVLASRNNKEMHKMVAAYKDGKTNLNGSLTQSAVFYHCLCLQPMVAIWRRTSLPTHQVTSRRCWLSYFRWAHLLAIAADTFPTTRLISVVFCGLMVAGDQRWVRSGGRRPGGKWCTSECFNMYDSPFIYRSIMVEWLCTFVQVLFQKQPKHVTQLYVYYKSLLSDISGPFLSWEF